MYKDKLRKEKESSFGPEEIPDDDGFNMDSTELSATVLDKREDLSNLVKAISRKQILHKVIIDKLKAIQFSLRCSATTSTCTVRRVMDTWKTATGSTQTCLEEQQKQRQELQDKARGQSKGGHLQK